MLFNYPVHAYLLNFQMLPSTAPVILFAACAGVGLRVGGGGGEGHTVCAHPCVSGYKWVVTDPLQGKRGGSIAILITGSLWPPLCLRLSKDGSMLPQVVPKIERLGEWSFPQRKCPA